MLTTVKVNRRRRRSVDDGPRVSRFTQGVLRRKDQGISTSVVPAFVKSCLPFDAHDYCRSFDSHLAEFPSPGCKPNPVPFPRVYLPVAGWEQSPNAFDALGAEIKDQIAAGLLAGMREITLTPATTISGKITAAILV